MAFVMKRNDFFNRTAATGAVCATLMLAGCGGGSDGRSSAAVVSSDSLAKVSAASIQVEGQSQDLSGDMKTIAVVTPPVTWNADGSLPQGKIRLIGRDHLASDLKTHAPGAYTTLPWGADSLSLSTGTVTDIAGNGHFAIGRWTAGSDSVGQSYNGNQGRVWAVGAPVDIRLAEQAKMSCTLAAATRPTTSDGNIAPGVLKTAAAVATGSADSFGRIGNHVELTLQYSIGGDVDQTFTTSAPVGALYLSRASQSSVLTTFLGPDESHPYLVVSYGVHAPTAGLINGLAVLNCS